MKAINKILKRNIIFTINSLSRKNIFSKSRYKLKFLIFGHVLFSILEEIVLIREWILLQKCFFESRLKKITTRPHSI